MKILIVEDYLEDRELMRRIVEHHGHEAIEAGDGQEALALAERETPDLIVSDLLMPGLDGFGLLKAIAERPRLRQVPFIVYSAIYTDLREKEWALSLGADAFLVKPLPPEALWEEIERVLSAKGQAHRKRQRPAPKEETEFLKEYSTTVAYRLEQKVKELQDTQSRLAVSESRYRLLFLSLQDVIFIADPSLQITDVNQPALRRVLGFESEEVVGGELCMFFDDILPAAELKRRLCQLTPERGETARFRTPVRRRDGSLIAGQVSTCGMFDLAGRQVGAIVSLRDVTREETATEEARLAHQEWDRTFDAINDVVTVQDREMLITRINAAGCALFHAQPGDLVGKHCYELFTGLDAPCEGCPVVESANDFQPHSQEVHHATLDKTFQVTAIPILDQGGQLTGIAHFARDITEQKEVERQLRQAQKLESIGILAGGIAHDFNNILTAIFGYGELLDMKLPESSPEREDLRQVLDAAHRARELVRQILTFSRSGERVFEPLALAPVVKEALKLLRASLPATIAIQQEIDRECRLVMADATQIHQVIMNLCTNAFHAMRETGGTLTVSLREVEVRSEGNELPTWHSPPPGVYLQLTVGDTGSGVPSYLTEKIFEPYFTTKERGEGTGLGLSVVHGIVLAHGGHIGVEGGEGRGAIFRVYLPAMANQDEHPVSPAVRLANISGAGERILLVDDELTLAQFEERALTAYGYRVTAVTSSEEAWEVFSARPRHFDLLMTDMTMPGLTGIELIERVRGVRRDLPVIVCTGFSDLIDDQRAREMDISALLMKPLTMRTLVKTVREALDSRGREQGV